MKNAAMTDLETPCVIGSDGNTLNAGPEDAENVISSLWLSKFDSDARTLGWDKKCMDDILDNDSCDGILLNNAEEVV